MICVFCWKWKKKKKSNRFGWLISLPPSLSSSSMSASPSVRMDVSDLKNHSILQNRMLASRIFNWVLFFRCSGMNLRAISNFWHWFRLSASTFDSRMSMPVSMHSNFWVETRKVRVWFVNISEISYFRMLITSIQTIALLMIVYVICMEMNGCDRCGRPVGGSSMGHRSTRCRLCVGRMLCPKNDFFSSSSSFRFVEISI